MTVTIHTGDCLAVMRTLAENSVDAVVTDPPYGIRFMGKAWDGADIEKRHAKRAAMESHAPDAGPNGGHKSVASEAGKYDLAPEAMKSFQRFSEAWAAEAFRVLKPGGLLLAFASPRTYHRMACGVEDAGFEVRDQVLWIFGSGFPKSHNGEWGGTACKPAHEPVVLARKPLEGTVAQNFARWGTGGLNIDGCRVGGAEGRWPANLIHDGSDEVIAAFPDAPGQLADASMDTGVRRTQSVYGTLRRGRGSEPSADRANLGSVGFAMKPGARRLDTGSAARFFYCAKATASDREAGLSGFAKVASGMVSNTSGQHITRRDEGYVPPQRANHHPTVKPTDLMRYLVRLITPAGGVVLDPFMGSGSTGRGAALEDLSFIGIELDPKYTAIATARIADAQRERGEELTAAREAARQTELFTENAA